MLRIRRAKQAIKRTANKANAVLPKITTCLKAFLENVYLYKIQGEDRLSLPVPDFAKATWSKCKTNPNSCKLTVDKSKSPQHVQTEDRKAQFLNSDKEEIHYDGESSEKCKILIFWDLF